MILTAQSEAFKLVPSCFVIFDLEPLSSSFDFVFASEIFKSLSFCLDRFGLPGEIVSDNGKQFCDNPFKDWCARLSITQRFASVKHPQTNGLVERANRSLGEGIKVRLDRHKGRWVEELSQGTLPSLLSMGQKPLYQPKSECQLFVPR
ncbi:reverse transcriptase domain-containing protein, partial [Tanacetum coccineum]